ncbi:MAG: DUF4340 domain-containing protein [Gammaproteobacteria bacterium]|nr:DUF4340 domain-containing protein [Gammaproteobacteria bacterium]
MNGWDRVTLVLGLLVATLAGGWFLAPVGPGPAGATLTPLDPAGISSIRVERNRQLTLELRADEDGWRLRHPYEAEADPRRVAQLAAIARAPVWQSLPAVGDHGRYGLDAPATILQLDGQRLLFGDRDPTQQGRYVLVDDAILVVDDIFHQLLTLPARHFTAP